MSTLFRQIQNRSMPVGITTSEARASRTDPKSQWMVTYSEMLHLRCSSLHLYTGAIILFLTGSCSARPLSAECKNAIQRMITAWTKDPKNFPNRVHGGVFIGNNPFMNSWFPDDFIIWDPLTQACIDLLCPSCDHPRLLLRPTRWKDGKAVSDQPRTLFCIQRRAILVSGVYRCTNDHQVLAHDPALLRQAHHFTCPCRIEGGRHRKVDRTDVLRKLLLRNLERFKTKWKDVACEGEPELPQAAMGEIEKLKKHISNGCLSNIPPSCGSNRNEALHKCLKKNISRQRLGIRLALALGVFFLCLE